MQTLACIYHDPSLCFALECGVIDQADAAGSAVGKSPEAQGVVVKTIPGGSVASSARVAWDLQQSRRRARKGRENREPVRRHAVSMTW